jgi:hypothetical protein
MLIPTAAVRLPAVGNLASQASRSGNEEVARRVVGIAEPYRSAARMLRRLLETLGAVEDSSVELDRCPYDGSPLEVEAYLGGSTLLFCSTCGAAWDCHERSLRRVRAPDRDAVRSARSHRDSPSSHGAPDRASAEATWRRVRSSIISICHGSDMIPPKSIPPTA